MATRVFSKRALLMLFVAISLAPASRAADSPFVGKWKLNPDKSKLADQMTIASAGEKKVTLTFAGAGETETLVADGTDQPGVSGTTASITMVGPGDWKFVRKRNGQVVITALWKLSADGKSLTDTFVSYQPDGSTSRIDLVYQRAAGSESTSGIPGTWETTDEKVDSVYEVELHPYEGNGLSLMVSGSPAAELRLDGKEYPSTGPSAAPGATTLSRRIDARTIELTSKLKGKILRTSSASRRTANS